MLAAGVDRIQLYVRLERILCGLRFDVHVPLEALPGLVVVQGVPAVQSAYRTAVYDTLTQPYSYVLVLLLTARSACRLGLTVSRVTLLVNALESIRACRY